MHLRVLSAILLVAVAGCGLSATSWGDFQSRALDAMERIKDADPLNAEPAFLTYLNQEQEWATGIRADACYDPALRAYRDFLAETITAHSTLPRGVPLENVPLDDLTAARDALERSLSEYERLSGTMVLATTACN